MVAANFIIEFNLEPVVDEILTWRVVDGRNKVALVGSEILRLTRNLKACELHLRRFDIYHVERIALPTDIVVLAL